MKSCFKGWGVAVGSQGCSLLEAPPKSSSWSRAVIIADVCRGGSVLTMKFQILITRGTNQWRWLCVNHLLTDMSFKTEWIFVSLQLSPSLFPYPVWTSAWLSLIFNAAHPPISHFKNIPQQSWPSLPVGKVDLPSSYVPHVPDGLTWTLNVHVCAEEWVRNLPVEEVTARVPIGPLWYIKIHVLTHAGDGVNYSDIVALKASY